MARLHGTPSDGAHNATLFVRSHPIHKGDAHLKNEAYAERGEPQVAPKLFHPEIFRTYCVVRYPKTSASRR